MEALKLLVKMHGAVWSIMTDAQKVRFYKGDWKTLGEYDLFASLHKAESLIAKAVDDDLINPPWLGAMALQREEIGRLLDA